MGTDAKNDKTPRHNVLSPMDGRRQNLRQNPPYEIHRGGDFVAGEVLAVRPYANLARGFWRGVLASRDWT